jgi:phospholipid transport system substrate-binding protein
MKYKLDFRLFIIPAVCLFVVAVSPLKSLGGEATNQIRQTVDNVVKILNNKELKKPGKKQERTAMIKAEVEKRFDFAEMAKRSLGIYWAKRSPEEKKEFVELYTDLLSDTYIRKIEKYEKEKVVYVGENDRGDYATVRTRVITTSGIETPVDYKIFKKGAKWEVYDIIVEGVSLVNNYRSQFSQIITSSSYDNLVNRMKKKTVKSSG